jgi:hypothetical protein
MRVRGESPDVVISLRIHRREPLAGTAAAHDGPELLFDGWMELIGVIAELLGSQGHMGSRGRQAPAGSGEESAER